ncbi:MAG TPA: ornithine cyclodeaminase family protein [Casimicrobiaceae bacterium]|nr:ornithine cyclodeaminase family protein [Casimicrobiaceae bacterium]
MSHAGSIRFISAEEVHAALDFPSLIEALREAFVAGASAPVRASHAVTPQGDRLLLMPAWNDAALGVKIVTVFPRNRERGLASVAALYLLMDGAIGHPLALIDGESLTLRRTGAASALASTYLSRSDASRLLVIGTGALAPYLARAHCAARTIRNVMVWGRLHEAAQRTVEQLRASGIAALVADDLDDALAHTDIVACATTSREAIVHGERVIAGTHVDLVGGFTPDMRECDDELIARASLFVDTRAGALKEAGDLVQPIARGVVSADAIEAELADLCAGRHGGRASADQITLFKSVGTALEDLCAARLVFERIASRADP